MKIPTLEKTEDGAPKSTASTFLSSNKLLSRLHTTSIRVSERQFVPLNELSSLKMDARVTILSRCPMLLCAFPGALSFAF